jgi:3-phenylpropionate/cinnamic acid dioxygenase small subunit
VDSRGEIENLMARYCRVYDDGDLEAYADLFEGATISGMAGRAEIIDFHRRNVYMYDGKPQTRHVITNIELDIDENAGRASGRCYLVCYQALPDFPLQPLFVGSYKDEFRRVDGAWRFSSRHFETHLAGDMSRHARPGTTLPDAH